MYFSLVIDLFVFFQEKKNDVGENVINSIEGEVIRLGNILEFFNKVGRISSIEF